jgi:hypothetical protein
MARFWSLFAGFKSVGGHFDYSHFQLSIVGVFHDHQSSLIGQDSPSSPCSLFVFTSGQFSSTLPQKMVLL